MYGVYNTPIKIENKSLTISIEKNEIGFSYIRDTLSEKVEKLLLAENAKILVNPVEPLNTPKELTSLLLIEFNKNISIQPHIRKTIFITFPVEIGIFLSKKREYELFDVFSLTKQKFTLYGNPEDGIICKYWKSDVLLTKPELDPLKEGFIELVIKNQSSSWVNIQKALFKAVGMKIFYDVKNVSMKAEMKVIDDETAEIEFLATPSEKNMKKALEIYTTRKLSVSQTKSVMQEGI
ncbi:MAG: DUF432 domain-containing protein [Candidatus Cloacimonetes bacterium]|jgi:hypothetical protein|nr:DUF432 domain-containing protein [Candidatus Cloacimonadota bacterium]